MTNTTKTFFILISCIVIVYSASNVFEKEDLELPQELTSNSFVVLELFTSQGCSSCPGADKLLRIIKDAAQEKALPIYTLSFHVDYWDHLGWKDSYSNNKNTQRQYAYSRAFSKRNIYTPQMVVNGKYEFVGSDKSTCESYITSVLHEKPGTNVKFSGNYSYLNEMIKVNYDVDNTFSGFLNIAIIQNEGQVNIEKGENRGSKINYSNIVRNFVQIDCLDKNQGQVVLKKPLDLEKNNLTILIYLQNKIDMRIVGAARATLL